MKHWQILMAGITGIALALPSRAQRERDYDASVVSQVRIELRDLGYPPIDVIPAGESAIRALAVSPDGHIYGATSGQRSHLFVLDPRHGYVEPLGTLPDTKVVHHALAVDQKGAVYIGTALAVENKTRVTEGVEGGHIHISWPTDLRRLHRVLAA